MRPSLPPARRRRGFALVLILSIVVLVTALVLGFVLRASVERVSASRYQATTSARLLATTVVGLVQGQVNQAANQDSTTTWTSQPGLVRTFNAAGMLRAFKLYSAPDMILGTGTSLGTGALQTSLAADMPPAAWASSRAVWTDLNAPVETNGTKIFPILENPATAPAGFAVANAPGGTPYQPVPMPVRWEYVLQDGTLVAPATSASGSTVTVAGASAGNPITGRVAFWTDDDTCRVNINTAAEGTFWDTPHGATATEQGYALHQPAQNEYQRYPGHPAMTSLSAVLPKSGTQTDAQWAEQLYQIAPRVVGGAGSSLEGTALSAGPLVPDSDRLYPSVDELVFSPARGTNGGLARSQVEQAKFFLTAHSRAPEVNLFNLPRIASWPVYALSGTTYDANRTTAFDRLIGTGSTVNGQPYFFQRQQPGSPTNDIGLLRNKQLYDYLRTLTSTAIPAFGGNFATKYGNDRDQILTEIFDYIRSTNLYDGNLAAGNQFTTPALGNKGHGWVVPTHYQPGSVMTQGFGRALTLSEFGIGFICNATADDPATPLDESYGSNDPGKNTALAGVALNPGEKRIQAIIVLELFSPMMGWTSLMPDMQVSITGLDKLSVTDSAGTTQLLFPASANGTTAYNFGSGSFYQGIPWGGNVGWKYCFLKKGSPARGSIPADPTTSLASYPFIGIPVTLTSPPSGGTMTFNGNPNIVVSLYAGSTTTPSASTLMQTININLPSGTFPVPILVNTGTVADAATGATVTMMQNWWSFPATTGAFSDPGVAVPPSSGLSNAPFLGRLALITDGAYDAGTKQLLAGAFFYNQPPNGTLPAAYNFDVIRTVVPAQGDYRLVAGLNNVPNTVFVKQAHYDDPAWMAASNLAGSTNPSSQPGNDMTGGYFAAMPWATGNDIPSNATVRPDTTGDFDSCLPNGLDGPYVNKPDEGNIQGLSGGAIPYFATYAAVTDATAAYFTPNRMMPSPGMFGSLPTGVQAGVPWRTLLFRPQGTHFGATSPEDHLLLDLFWMPVVEPYAISDRFSTEGKINMNYQIVPFGVGATPYLTRSTGIRALLKSEKVSAIPNGTGKTDGYALFRSASSAAMSASAAQTESRFTIDADQTLQQFDAKFAGGDVFKSESEICDLHIVPAGALLADMPTFWASHVGTGDNLRERIYTTLYPRLTTRSNTYTVYFRVQSLKNPSTDPGNWNENTGTVTGEYRGSAMLERFIDANNTAIPDYAANAASVFSQTPLGKFYKWRVLENRQFSP